MLLFLLFLVPLLAVGIIIFRKISTLGRFELLFPAGSILGLAFFTFLLNSLAFILKGKAAITAAYVLMLLIGLIAFYTLQKDKEKISFPKGRQLIYWFTGIVVWGGFIFWKAAHALIGSDANLYYAAAATFIKGNFPLMTPWQPDIPFSYHTGASELLGAFNVFSGLDFQFLHLFFSAFFIFCIAQIIIMIILNTVSITKFLFANVAVAGVLISWGFFYLVWPVFPLDFPDIEGFNSLILWLRDLPNAGSAIEIYGAPFNIDALIYFLFHAFGLGLFFSLLILTANLKKNNSIFPLTAVFIGLAALALVNESVFAAAFPAIFLGIIIVNFYRKTLAKNFKRIFFLTGFLLLTVFLQGGVISALANNSSAIEKSVVIFPSKEDVNDDFQSYHQGQEPFKILPLKDQWLPLGWIHPGIIIMMIFSIPAIFWFRKETDKSLLLKMLFAAGFSSLLAFNFIVPKFLVANGNRFLSASYIFFSLILILAFIWFYETEKKKIRKALLLMIAFWIFIPTILPPLALISKTRFGENKLIPRKPQISEGIKQLKERQFNERVLVLDKNAPHPSGQFRAMIDAGLFAPLFAGNFRVFTVEASPEYLDAAYYLNPKALASLKIDTLLVDDMFYQTLPNLRKQQLNNDEYFEQIFAQSAGENPEKIFRIKNKFLKEGSEIERSFAELKSFIPSGRIYIDSEKNFNPSYLRKALIFSLRDKDIYYLPESGVYLNVETNINSHPPREDHDYEYLVLGKNTNPLNLCNCQTKLIWTGIKGQVFLWKASR